MLAFKIDHVPGHPGGFLRMHSAKASDGENGNQVHRRSGERHRTEFLPPGRFLVFLGLDLEASGGQVEEFAGFLDGKNPHGGFLHGGRPPRERPAGGLAWRTANRTALVSERPTLSQARNAASASASWAAQDKIFEIVPMGDHRNGACSMLGLQRSASGKDGSCCCPWHTDRIDPFA